MIIFSLCAGKSTRWNVDGIKQLVDIKGEPLLKRTIRKFKEKGEDIVIVTDNPELKFGTVIDPIAKEYTCDSLLSTWPAWSGKVVILLGDVLYSDALINQILECDDEFRVFNNWEEIFALVFDSRVYYKVKENLIKTLQKDNPGKLWDFVREYLGGKRKDYTKKEFTYVDDYTQDFDDSRDINLYKEKIKKYKYE